MNPCLPAQPAAPVRDDRDARQSETEHEFLRGAEKRAGLDSGWSQGVQDRLLRMERAKGRDSYRSLSIARFLTEIEEESFDLGGWPVLAALVTYASDLDDETAHELRLVLQAIAAEGARAHALVAQCRALLA